MSRSISGEAATVWLGCVSRSQTSGPDGITFGVASRDRYRWDRPIGFPATFSEYLDREQRSAPSQQQQLIWVAPAPVLRRVLPVSQYRAMGRSMPAR